MERRISVGILRPKLNKWSTSRGDPEYSGHEKPKRAFRPKFPESLAKWKAPHFYCVLNRKPKNGVSHDLSYPGMDQRSRLPCVAALVELDDLRSLG